MYLFFVAGPQTDYSIKEGERLLKEMEEQDFSEAEDEAEKVLSKAGQVKDDMTKFAEPVTNHSRLFNELQKQVNEFNQKLEDLRNNSDATLKMSTQTKILNQQNRYVVISMDKKFHTLFYC